MPCTLTPHAARHSSCTELPNSDTGPIFRAANICAAMPWSTRSRSSSEADAPAASRCTCLARLGRSPCRLLLTCTMAPCPCMAMRANTSSEQPNKSAVEPSGCTLTGNACAVDVASPITTTMCSAPSRADVNVCTVSGPCRDVTVAVSDSVTSCSCRSRYRMRSAMEMHLSPCCLANSRRSGVRAMLPSRLLTISDNTPAGKEPARRARSTLASVWPGRTNTPPGRQRSGKMCPGRLKSAAVAAGSAMVRSVLARSDAEMPVVMPSRRSTVTVNAVYMVSSFSSDRTMSGRLSRSRSAPSIPMHTTPLVYSTMNAMAAASTLSAAMMRSPSFSRLSSSSTTKNLPALTSSSASEMASKPSMGMSRSRSVGKVSVSRAWP
mmetsp:Transcript_22421/g.66762  ORF Transcript_22421/g.66762 Transcript_22421/m.66762 type:complete len:379 (+) Transcript_22421:919-2055(+)